MELYAPPPMSEYSDKESRSSVCRRVGWYLFFLIILVIIIVLTLVIMKYKPSIPAIDITEFDTVTFVMGPGSVLHTKFVLSVKVDNSNTGFRITLDKGSSINMSYNNTAISAGKLPVFRQEPGTVRNLKAVLEGKNKVQGDLKIVKSKCKKSSSVPLLLLLDLPFALEAKGFVTAHVSYNFVCVLVVDHLDVEQQPNHLISHTCVPNC